MHEMCRGARKRLRGLARDRAGEFETTICHNRVNEALCGQNEHAAVLKELVDLVERTYQFSEQRRVKEATDGPLERDAFSAAERLGEHVDDVDETIAAALADLLAGIEADDWTDAWDPDEIDAATHEAREWLQVHHDAAERAGVWEEVTE